MAEATLAEVLADLTKEGELYEALPDGKIRCFACGHRCPIPEGRAGVCRVRFNKGGKLYVPSGYVGALQDDPIEKKPFFHALPGTRALSFGMLGCDFHCGYCFTPAMKIATTKGLLPIGEIVSRATDLEIYTHAGNWRRIKTFFKRPYQGPIVKIKPALLPPIECTPEHPFLSCLKVEQEGGFRPEFVEANALTVEHLLAIPKPFNFFEEVTVKAEFQDEKYRYVPIQTIEAEYYDGQVFNLETEQDHTYLAGLVTVHNCQNWVTSQALRDPVAGAPPIKLGPKEFVELSIKRGCQVLASTYNEPLITSEWAVDIFKEAKAAGLVTAYISNGNGTPQVLDYIRPWVDLYKVDLKGFDDRHYRELGGVLDNVLETIKNLFERKFWLEIVTLLIPGFNDSDEEIDGLTQFVASVSPDIPWHCTAFHKDYKMTDPENTPAATLVRAAKIGRKNGLRYIYAGNLPGMVGEWENTVCPRCHEVLIKRYGFAVLKNALDSKGACPNCKTPIPGFWGDGVFNPQRK